MNKTKELVKELKNNNEDFEFYPTSKEMVAPIYKRMGDIRSILDIGCGTGQFKQHIDSINKDNKNNKNNYDKDGYYQGAHIKFDYYVMEKSRILISNLDKNAIVLGTDFNHSLLLDKKVDAIFCNPPYSEYKDWTTRIMLEGNFKQAFLIIPQRWKDDKDISIAIASSKLAVSVIGSFDFLNAERSARAKVDVLQITRLSVNRHQDDVNQSAFDAWFDATFDIKTDYSDKFKTESREQQIKNSIVSCESKTDMLVELYNNEIKTLLHHFKAITSMDEDILKTIGVSYQGVKTAIQQKTASLKILYWKIIFDEVKEITDRLTHATREDLRKRFSMINTAEFNEDNIYSLIIWIIKNANSYYNEQLVDFYKKLSEPSNVKPYKSNQKVFERSEYRHNRFENPENISHYTLDYRIIASYMFKSSWSGSSLNDWENIKVIDDMCAIANNLGFKTGLKKSPKNFGEKYYIKDHKEEKVLIEFKVYKNGNAHIRLDMELSKAINVEVSRLLGWINTKEDIKKEFPDDMAKGAEKYFKSNLTFFPSNILLLN